MPLREGLRLALFLAATVAAAAILVWLAPEERTLGAGIKPVYVHVSLSVAGLAGLALAAILGVGILLTGRAGLCGWMVPVGRVGLFVYAAGVAVSLVAARVNWGPGFLGEPLLPASLSLLAVGIIALSLAAWTSVPRLQALLHAVPALALVGLAAGVPLGMHPRGDIVATAPGPIRWTFVALVVLCLSASARIVVYLRRRGV